MPTAGEEGYEKFVVCPYDRSHEIRLGRIQFHLAKCRQNYPNAEMIECPFNSSHVVRKVELEFHTKEDCLSRAIWDCHTHKIGDTYCPVRDLVPVNAATVPDGGENWDDFDSQSSVLDLIKAEAAQKPILRIAQCVSPSKKKAFRFEERLRHSKIEEESKAEKLTDISSLVLNTEPLRRPTKIPKVPIIKQDPFIAAKIIKDEYRLWSVGTEFGKQTTPSETALIRNSPLPVTKSSSLLLQSSRPSHRVPANPPPGFQDIQPSFTTCFPKSSTEWSIAMPTVISKVHCPSSTVAAAESLLLTPISAIRKPRIVPDMGLRGTSNVSQTTSTVRVSTSSPTGSTATYTVASECSRPIPTVSCAESVVKEKSNRPRVHGYGRGKPKI